MMTVEILSEVEGTPSSYPAAPPGLSDEASNLDNVALWKRIESFITYRWKERSLTYIVQGPGVFQAILQPFTLDTAKIWNGATWESTTLDPAPLGYELEEAAYKISGTVGTTDDMPSDLTEAYKRLAEYLADQSYIGRVATSMTQSAGAAQVSADRPASWQGKALFYSGAADLLRRYR